MATYFTMMEAFWNEYDAMIPSPLYDCLKSKDYTNHLSQLRAMKFLGA